MARRDAALKRALNGTMRGGTITVRHVLMKYMAWIEQGNDRRNSIARKRDRLERYLKPYMGKPMKSFDSDDVGAIITAARAALSTGFNRATMNELPELMNHGNNLLNFININNENKK